ncbi:glycosyltransferase family 9 protein [Alteromonas sp. H39]|uniref:glycosyltransferase family 9 protein n=1 Tax=Alteromonas sp. H39 TaxID=3389876 RepID=UPI0039DFB0B1
MSEKILLIRMAEQGDVLAIGLPAVRYFQKRYSNAQITVLTYGSCGVFFEKGAPQVQVMRLEQGHWPDNIVIAMETFLGLAEKVVAENFSHIVNLDTAFMPCFLARFLKDAGEPVEGNFLSYPVAELIDELQQETLKPAKVSDAETYLASTWLTFGQWFTQWWDSAAPPAGGYPEYFLKRCCGLRDIDIDMTLPASAIPPVKPYIAIYNETAQQGLLDTQAFTRLLGEKGVQYRELSGDGDITENLQLVKGAELLVTIPSAFQWYAVATQTPTLLLAGSFDPRITMPDYATTVNQPIDAEVIVNDIVNLLESS